VGGAWADVSASVNGPFGFGASAGGTASGWVVGVGAEYAFRNNWSAKVEYNHFDFGGDSGTFITGNSVTLQTLKVGVNYRFGQSTAALPRHFRRRFSKPISSESLASTPTQPTAFSTRLWPSNNPTARKFPLSRVDQGRLRAAHRVRGELPWLKTDAGNPPLHQARVLPRSSEIDLSRPDPKTEPAPRLTTAAGQKRVEPLPRLSVNSNLC
jgi:Outer membrane protein beta-barrel domain